MSPCLYPKILTGERFISGFDLLHVDTRDDMRGDSGGRPCTDSCITLLSAADDSDLIDESIGHGSVSYTHLTLPTNPYV